MKKSRVISRTRSASPKLPELTLLNKLSSCRQPGKKAPSSKDKPS